jgi:hypothetical protein
MIPRTPKRLFAVLLLAFGFAIAQQSPTQKGEGTQNASKPADLSRTATESHPSALETTLITALGALLGVLLKDLVFKILEERRTRDKELEAVYARYADPLASATVSLMWRLHEIVNKPGRGRFLKIIGVPASTNKYSTYGAYKKLSTLYRLAALLGWTRACRREFSYLKVADSGHLRPVDEAIATIERALADGPAVEIERARKLCELWHLPIPAEEGKLSSIAVEVEAAIDEFMQAERVSEISVLDDERTLNLVRVAASVLSDGLQVSTPPDKILDETVSRAAQILDIKEAWIYRDWQAAIGDLMIRSVENADRRFEVIGFSEFESMYHCGTEEQKKWMVRLGSVFDGIDVSKLDPFDYRRRQISSLLRACARLTLALAECTKSASIDVSTAQTATSIASTLNDAEA